MSFVITHNKALLGQVSPAGTAFGVVRHKARRYVH
jgi:hypothetical protein